MKSAPFAFAVLLFIQSASAESAKEAWTKLCGANMAKRSAFAYVEVDAKLPKVLIYGDSISIGYTPRVREQLKGKADVIRLHCNGGDSGTFISKMTKMHSVMENDSLDQPWSFKWDVIHFNVGLHDLKYWADGKLDVEKGTQVNSTEVYEKNLEAIVAYLKNHSPKAKLIYCMTTPVPEKSGGRKAGDAAIYNEVALKVMKKHPEIAINDLYGFTKPKQREWWTRPGNVHFTKKGTDAQGDEVARVILESLVKRAK